MKLIHLLIYITLLSLPAGFAYSQQWESLNAEFETLQAEKRFTESLSIAIKSLDSAERQYGVHSKQYEKSLTSLADSYMMLAQWDKARKYYKELLRREFRRLAEIDVNMSTTIQSITTLYGLLHDQKSAATLYKQATRRLARVQRVENSIYTEMSDYYTQALMSQPAPTADQSLDLIAKQTGVDVSSMQQTVKQYAPHLTVNSDDKQLPSPSENKSRKSIQELLDTCAKHKQYSNFTRGIHSCKKLYDLQQARELQHTIEHARTCFDLGYFYMLSSKHSESISYYLEGIDLWEQNNFAKTGQYIEALYNTSGSLQLSQRYKEAKSLLLKAESAASGLTGDKHSLYPGILLMLATMQRVEGDYSTAEKSYDRYKNYYRYKNNRDPAVWLNYYLGAGLLYERLGKWKEADRTHLAYNRATVDLLSELFKYVTLSSEKQVAQNFVSFRYNQDFFYSYCNKRKDQNPNLLEQMYNNELVTKGLVLRTLQQLINRIYQSADPVLIKSFEQWIEVRQKIAKLSLLPVSSRMMNLDELERRIKQLEQKLMAWMLSNQQNQRLELNWRDIQSKLQADDAAIEFIKFQEFDLEEQSWSSKVWYGALIISQDSSHPIFINLFKESEFKSFLKNTSDPNPFEQVRKMYTWLPGKYGNIYQGDILYKLVWERLEAHLKGVQNVYYSPSGLLHQISFDAIPVSGEKTLVGKYSLQRLSSTGLLADKISTCNFTKKDQALLFGGMQFDLTPEQQRDAINKKKKGTAEFIFSRDSSFDWTRSKSTGDSWPYLKGTLEEVNRIGDILQTKKRRYQIFSGPQGGEEQFKQLSGNSKDIIHIATHGFFLPISKTQKTERLQPIHTNNGIDPEATFKRSGLLFAGANSTWLGENLAAGLEDGILTAHEISKLNLNKTKLVILSACETGLGDIDDAEGVYGLQRAFKLAGVDNIIMSLWQIPDTQTAELMDLFYSEWLKGSELRQAFHSAQQRMSKKYEPYFWGAFVLVQ